MTTMIMCAWTPGPETLPGRLELDQSRGKLDTQHELSSMSGVTPRPYVVLETLLAPLLVVVEQLFWPWFDYQARCYKQSDRAPSFVEINEEEEEEENTKEE